MHACMYVSTCTGTSWGPPDNVHASPKLSQTASLIMHAAALEQFKAWLTVPLVPMLILFMHTKVWYMVATCINGQHLCQDAMSD